MRGYRFEVTLDGPEETVVVGVDQRDIRAWEAKEERSWLDESLSITTMTRLCHLALVRGGLTDDWDVWEPRVVWVAEVGEPDAARPTRKARTAGRS
jgi:hypothetical protein